MTLVQFEHTHLGAYVVGTFTVTCFFSDSAQGLIERNRLNRKWLLLYGILCIFAYLYARPFIRVGLGSAKRGYINFSTLYIVWLCSAVFYHLPSLEQLGLDVRADVSLLIVLFMSSLAALSLLAGLHTAAVSLRLLPRRAYLPAVANASSDSSSGADARGATRRAVRSASSGLRELWILLLLNSMIIAVACSTYYSFCGNGTLVVDGSTPALKAAVCAKWLHPILTSDYPRFASWMLYGEGSAYSLAGGSGNCPAEADSAASFGASSGSGHQNVSSTAAGLIIRSGFGNHTQRDGDAGRSSGSSGCISVDFPFDGRGEQSVPAGNVLSPVLCMWVTLVAVYMANTMAGHPRLVQAAATDALSSSSIGGIRERGSDRKGNDNAGRVSSDRGRRSSSRIGPNGPPSMSSLSSSSSRSVRRTASFRRATNSSDRKMDGGATAGDSGATTAAAAAAGAAASATAVTGAAAALAVVGGSDGMRKSRKRSLEVKKSISKGLSKAAAATGSAARGAAATAALVAASSAARGAAAAAARRSMSSLRGLAASTGRLKRAASDYLHTSHPYLPALLVQVQRGMAALEPNHLAAELAEATGLAPDLARALTRGSSFSALSDVTAASSILSPSFRAVSALGISSVAAASGSVATAADAGAALPSQYFGRAAGAGGNGGRATSAVGAGSCSSLQGVVAIASGELAVSAAVPAATLAVSPPQPEFLDMVPWYSGTSADLFKTLFDLMVSVKLFLGRFDMRTMQAATAASMADSFNDTPSEGDGFTYEHLDERPQLWLDFMADTGDGGNPTYAVAAALAAPALTVHVSDDLPLPALPPADIVRGEEEKTRSKGRTAADGRKPSPPRPGSSLVLPRGDVLVLGGDLAYPNPSRETYQHRLFTPFSDALPPPPHFHPGRLVVHKPDLPPSWGVQEALLPCDLRGLSPRSSRRASSAALRRYTGPTAFAIPGNHDWIDGLETFTREIQHKGWLGGWLLPQEKSYFALRLPAGWWLFGFDLALVQDIDMQQYRYFANVVEQRMGPEEQVILVTHEPLWLLEWFWQRRHGANLRQLVRGHLRGRARIHLAGDLHFYMRHTWNGMAAEAGATAESPLPAAPATSAPARGGDCVGGGGQKSAHGTDTGAVPMSAGSDDVSLYRRSSALVSEGLQQSRGAALPARTTPVALLRAAGAIIAPHCAPGGSSSNEDFSGISPAASCSSLERPLHPNDKSQSQPRHQAQGVPAPSHSPQWPQQRTAASGAPSDPGGRFTEELPVPATSAFAYHQVVERARAESGLQQRSTRSQSQPQLHSHSHQQRQPQLHPSPFRLAPPLHLRFDEGTLGLARPGEEEGGAGAGEGGGGGAAVRRSCLPDLSLCEACVARRRWVRHPHDPQHLVVNGGGGAFLHPTHVFAGARFPAPLDQAADATAGLYAAVALPCTCGVYAPGEAVYGGAPGGRIGPWLTCGDGSPPQSLRPTEVGAPGIPFHTPKDPSVARKVPAVRGFHCANTGGGGGDGISGYAPIGPDGEYVCAACYPSPRTSMHLGRRNLHVFRLRNTRFDVIGGVFYFLLVVSVLPRCSHLAEVLEADTPGKALSLLAAAYVETLGAIVGRSYLSAVALALLFLMSLGLAKGGGFGAVKSSMPSPSNIYNGNGAVGATAAPLAAVPEGAATAVPTVTAPRPLITARIGGFGVQLAFATAHCMTHVSLAIVLLLLLELGVETCIKYERLGADGPHSLYRWYRAYEEQHFPDPMGLRRSLERWTMGLYPGVLQLAMSVYDVPELIAVTRTAMCKAGGSLEPINRLQAVSYYAGMLSYYWLLATPAMGFVFGLYLYLSVCWCHVHYDEAFSSLREASCKSFCRLHIAPSGDLQLYTLALDEVPTRWQEDPRWRGPHGGGSPGVVVHEAHYPSRWVPAWLDAARRKREGAATVLPAGDGRAMAAAAGSSRAAFPAARWRLVDYVFLPRKQL